MGKIKLVIPLLLFIFLVACENEKANTKEVFDNPLKASVNTTIENLSYEQTIEEADLIVEVGIQRSQGIIEGGTNIIAKTKFEGRINKVYEGSRKINDTISILQDGKKGMEVENYPLFKSGETYILTLMDSGNGKTYWIKGQTNGTYMMGNRSMLKFGKKEEDLPEKEDTGDAEHNIIEKQKETNGNSQMLDSSKFKTKLQNDILKIRNKSNVSPLQNIEMEDIKNKLANKDDFILYIGRDSCPYCQEFKPKLEKYLKKNGKKILYFNTEPENKREKFRIFYNSLGAEGVPVLLKFSNGDVEKITYGTDEFGNIEKLLQK
ncbi:thioredoxin family protein [Listeria booriae]|uniref:thioredoxin family protein n=1 Tax=Listeria booriae TaxID=1552123 RepID=UPI0016297FA4|nr:thioredoxin family protein [Listeria booriae]MBC2173330.1 hypothetical protein [Listeria booriae]